VNPGDEQTIRQRLHTELDSVEISPAPINSMTRQGRAIRARRRVLASSAAAVAVAAVLAARFIAAPGPAPDANAVTLNAPNPSAPGGVFASGAADGKPWRLAVRNIAGPGTRWCVPAVMLNGRDGKVLFAAAHGNPSLGYPALLREIPGLPGIGAMVTQLAPGTTRLVATLPDGGKLAVRPVRVAVCGHSFNLAGFLFTDPQDGISQLAAYSGRGFAGRLSLSDRATGASLFAATPAGVWASLDSSRRDIAASRASHLIGTGTVAGKTWRIRTGLGLFGQCYAAILRGGGHSYRCVPVAAPPRAIAVDYVPIPRGRSHLAGYVGLVSPRTASVVVEFSSGLPHTYKPVSVAGRKYLAIVAPPDNVVDRVSLLDGAGREFASAVTPAGGMTGTLPMGK
jgi:hypothetical protein